MNRHMGKQHVANYIVVSNKMVECNSVFSLVKKTSYNKERVGSFDDKGVPPSPLWGRKTGLL